MKKWMDMTQAEMRKEVERRISLIFDGGSPQMNPMSALDRLAQSQPALSKLKEMANDRGNDSRTMASMGNRNSNLSKPGG